MNDCVLDVLLDHLRDLDLPTILASMADRLEPYSHYVMSYDVSFCLLQGAVMPGPTLPIYRYAMSRITFVIM